MGYAERINAAYPQAGIELSREIVRVAGVVGAHPYDLANLINHESARTFSPSVRNPRSNATGLIQFMPKTAPDYGVTVDQLAAMGKVQQMRYVEKYLRNRARKFGPLDSPQKLFMSVFYPAAVNWPLDKEFPSRVQKSNPGTFKVRDYVSHAIRGAKLPSSSNPGAAPWLTLPFGYAKRVAKTVPIWGFATGAVLVALLLGLTVSRAHRRRLTKRSSP
jgi:hypothetical protein